MGRWITMGLLMLASLGCSGIYVGDEPVVPDDAIDKDTGEEDDGVAEGDTGLETGLDTGHPKPRPKKDKKKRKKRPGEGGKGGKSKKPGGGKGGDKPGGGKPGAGKPGGGNKSGSMCFVASGASKLDLRFDLDGTNVTGGSLSLDNGKSKTTASNLKGTKGKDRITASGKGRVGGADKTVQVQAGQREGKVMVQVDGQTVKGATKTPCK